MPAPKKLRRSIDARTSSIAKGLVELHKPEYNEFHERVVRPTPIKDPRVRFAVISVATACLGLQTQMQQVAAACKAAQQAFAVVFPEDETRHQIEEMFENLGLLIMHSSDGPMTEALEVLVVLALHAADDESQMRALSAAAASLGLDTSDIALDDEDSTKAPRGRTNSKRDALTRLTSASDRLQVEAVAQVAVARNLPLIGVEPDGGKFRLVGCTVDRSRSDRLCELDCDFPEAQRIVVLVTKFVNRALG
jgi:hypothetical protein